MWHKMAADVAQDDRPAGSKAIMATKKIPYQYYLRQDKSSNPRKSGKYYAKRFNPTVLAPIILHVYSMAVILPPCWRP